MNAMLRPVSAAMAKFVVALVLVLGTVTALPDPSRKSDWRIVGGSTAPDGAYPYQISLRTPQNRHFCGGSIIGTQWILTAAHCVYGQSASSMMIVVGTNYLNTGGTAYGVSQVTWHEGYNQQNNANDIALLRTSVSISYNSRVQPVGLASSPLPAGTPCVLSGWGLTSYPSQSLPNSLQHILLTSISVSQCQSALPGYPVFNTHVCTYQGYGQGACQGDSGGPLVGNGVQQGVVSWGIPCAKGNPDIFTSVASYRTWIAAVAGI